MVCRSKNYYAELWNHKLKILDRNTTHEIRQVTKSRKKITYVQLKLFMSTVMRVYSTLLVSIKFACTAQKTLLFIYHLMVKKINLHLSRLRIFFTTVCVNSNLSLQKIFELKEINEIISTQLIILRVMPFATQRHERKILRIIFILHKLSCFCFDQAWKTPKAHVRSLLWIKKS